MMGFCRAANTRNSTSRMSPGVLGASATTAFVTASPTPLNAAAAAAAVVAYPYSSNTFTRPHNPYGAYVS